MARKQVRQPMSTMSKDSGVFVGRLFCLFVMLVVQVNVFDIRVHDCIKACSEGDCLYGRE